MLPKRARKTTTASSSTVRGPCRYLNSLGVFNGRTVAAHGVWLDQGDMDILLKTGVGVAHCPSSNMKLASGVAPVTQMLAMGIAVGLGPDGPAGSNNDFDMMEEMNLAANLQKVATNDPRSLPAEQAVAMATINGARVIGGAAILAPRSRQAAPTWS